MTIEGTRLEFEHQVGAQTSEIQANDPEQIRCEHLEKTRILYFDVLFIRIKAGFPAEYGSPGDGEL